MKKSLLIFGLVCIVLAAICLFTGYYIHPKLRAADYARTELSKFYGVPPSRIHITRVSSIGNFEERFVSHENWQVNFEIDGVNSAAGNLCEFSESKSGEFLDFVLPTS